MNRHVLYRALTHWILPKKFGELLSEYDPKSVQYYLRHRNELAKNKGLINLHAGQRCFILCNGPSVLKQDISRLKGEIVISVSNGYHHPDYSQIAPLYHCVPGITYGTLTETDVVNWFREMQEKIGHAMLFLNYTEQELVTKNNLFTTSDVRFLCMGREHYPTTIKGLELSGIIPRVQSVPLMAIMIAMHVGCTKIYLLGTEHDWFLKNEYKYFYKPTVLSGKDDSVNPDGSIKSGVYDNLSGALALWKQYRAVKVLASQAGVKILNATAGGALDEFERVNYESVVC